MDRTKMNEYLNKVLKSDGVDYVIGIDTDSIYLNMGPLLCVFKGREALEIVNFMIRSVTWNLKSILKVLTKSCGLPQRSRKQNGDET